MSSDLKSKFHQNNLNGAKSSGALIYEFEGFRLDAEHLMLYSDGEEVSLRPKQVETLLALLERSGEIISKGVLMERLWGDAPVEESNLIQNIYILRKILGERVNGKPMIETLRRRGYRFNAELKLVGSRHSEPAVPASPGQLPAGPGSAAAAMTRRHIVAPPSIGLEPLEKESLNEEIAQVQSYRLAKSRIGAVALTALVVTASTMLIAGLIYWEFYGRDTTGVTEIRSIAVMPFMNKSGNPDIEYLSDGITESLIGSLSQIPELSVKARSSVFTYKGKDVALETVAKDLSVQSILNGYVLQEGDRIQLNVELVDARTGNRIWGDKYVRRMADLPRLQSEIAIDVSNKLRFRLTGAEEKRIAKNYTENKEAYKLYSLGRYHWNKRTGEDIRKSIGYFHQAIEEDPGYGLAYAALAEGYILLPQYTKESPHVTFPKARAAAIRALELDESLSEAHTALGSVLGDYEWNFTAAEKEYRRAIELNPNYATAHQWYGEFLAYMGRYDEAVAELKLAQELDPLSLVINASLGEFYWLNGQYDLSIERLNKTLQMDPNFAWTHLLLAEAYEKMGKYEDASDESAKGFARMWGEPEKEKLISAALKAGHRSSGAKGYFLKLAAIREARRAAKADDMPSLSAIAGYYARAGVTEKAFDLLEMSFTEHELNLVYTIKGPRFNSMKPDPRYRGLLRRIGFPE
jgi:TolB-like protein/DNA-binding winged helix-turn-helix (wHTH) protein